MIDVQDPFRLARDVYFIAADELDPERRARAQAQPGETLISRRNGRARSKVLTPEAFGFVQRFQSGVTLADAIAGWAREAGADPKDALGQMLPLINALIKAGFIVQASDAALDASGPRHPEGSQIGGFRIVRCVKFYDDTELHEVHHPDLGRAALKIARAPDAPKSAQIQREAEVLRALDLDCVPDLLGAGTEDGCAWLAMRWHDGETVARTADRCRGTADGRGSLRDLCVDMVRAFAKLHDAGVVHGDIHPENVLVTEAGIIVLDFGYARVLSGPAHLREMKRGGVEFFFEPEYAAAHLAAVPPPPATPLGEQYGIAALLYYLVSGRPYLRFSYDAATVYRQILTDTPRPFSDAGAVPWPAMESVLARALSKDSADRFKDLHPFARALAAAERPAAAPCLSAGAQGQELDGALDLLVRDALRRLGPDGPEGQTGLSRAPTGSVHGGASGIAYALMRLAQARGDADVLSLASLWSHRAFAARRAPTGYLSPGDDITPATVGLRAISHAPIGTAYVHALVADAAGDVPALTKAVELFCAETGAECPTDDLFLGRAGHLMAAAAMLRAVGAARRYVPTEQLLAHGDRLRRDLLTLVEAESPLSPDRVDRFGVAHGWSGLLLSLMAWASATGDPAPDVVAARLRDLRRCARDTAHGLRWPIGSGAKLSQDHMAGWCNGGAGHALAYLAGARMFDDDAFLSVAEQAAREADAECGATSVPFLCCGNAGVAFAHLALHRRTGRAEWLERARHQAGLAAEGIASPRLPFQSLFRGAVGCVALAAGISAPEQARFPVFGHGVELE